MNALTPTLRTAAEAAILARYDDARDALPGGEGLRGLREAAMLAFARDGLPTRRVEAWHYSDLRAALREIAPAAAPADGAATARARALLDALPPAGAHRFAIVNGRHAPDLSAPGAPEGVALAPLAAALRDGRVEVLERWGRTAALAEGDQALALNTAFATDGAVITVAPGARVALPLHLAFVEAGDRPAASAARVLVSVGAGAEVTLIETHQGTAGVAHQPNHALEIALGDGAKVAHVRLDLDDPEAVALNTLVIRLGEGAVLESHGLRTGARFSRNQAFVAFSGDRARLVLRGAALLRDRQHADSTLVVDHAALHGESREGYRHVVDDEAVGVFQGKIVVRPGAQKTDGRMMSAALLLAEGATMNNKPELEIFADDVQCAHGATCGALNDDHLFYLRARGLPKPEAEALLARAFVAAAFEDLAHEGLKDAIEGMVGAWFTERAARAAKEAVA